MNKLTELPPVLPKEEQVMVAHEARKHLIEYSIATDQNYQDTWFHETLAEILEDSLKKVEAGEDVRIILECPPRHGKSEISTKKFTSWILGKHPEWPIIVASYSSDLATKFGQETRDIMNSPQYQSIFSTRLSKDSKAKAYWKTGVGGSYMAAGAGGAFTGTGFKIGIIDDIFKNREEADSQVVRNSRWDWYKSTFYTRQEGNTAIIVINTRWHMDDLVGRLLEQQKKSELNGELNYDKWQRIKFPAIATENEEHRKVGEPLWPDKFGIDKLRKIETALGPYEFTSLYQATPISSENQEFKPQWFKDRSWAEVDALDTRKFATIDPGGKELENDFTGVIRNYIDRQNNWNIKAMRVHFDAPEVINLLFKLHEEGFEKIGVEETVYLKVIKSFFDQECRKRNRFPNVVELKHAGRNKEARIRGVIPRYASGSIYHITGECKDLVDELIVFPKGAHDDTIDALAYQNDIAEIPVDEHKIARTVAIRAKKAEDVARRHGL
jgi:hypothetical protein